MSTLTRTIARTSDVIRFLGRKLRMQIMGRAGLSRNYIEHYGIHYPRNNAGDAVLFQAVEDLFDFAYGRQRWHRSSLRRPVLRRDICTVNRDARAVLVGGGGLLIASDSARSESGWQWRISQELLSHLEVPLVVFAVGYNQFRDSVEFAPIFDEHLKTTVEKSVFFGARNSGSVRQVRARLPAALRGKVVFQPCVTTLLRKFAPDLLQAPPPVFSRRVAVNLAFDRANGRYGKNTSEIIARIDRIVGWALDNKWEVTVVLQAWEDEPVVSALGTRAREVRFQRLSMMPPEKVIAFYARMPVTIGMRGHAQLIPFGCGNAIFSLVSHDKMQFFLEDIERPEWGVDIRDRYLSDKVIAFLSTLERSWGDVTRHIAVQQEHFWSTTLSNLSVIARPTGLRVVDRAGESVTAHP